jgi:hypothetical protein
MTYQVVSLISTYAVMLAGGRGAGFGHHQKKKNVLLVQLLAKISSRSESRARFRQQKAGARAGLGHVRCTVHPPNERCFLPCTTSTVRDVSVTRTHTPIDRYVQATRPGMCSQTHAPIHHRALRIVRDHACSIEQLVFS